MSSRESFSTFHFFWRIFIPLAVVLVGVVLASVLNNLMLFKERIKLQERDLVESQAQVLAIEISDHVSDAVFLAQVTGQTMEENHDRRETTKELTELYFALVRQKPVYYQVRFLDTRGRERVRINSSDGDYKIIPPHKLQDKGERYYFRQALDLKRGQVYLSRFDLNVEHGQVERPFKPMLRFASPVVDEKGTKYGVVVLNFAGTQLLRRIQKAAVLSRGRLMLLDSQGYWLVGPSPEWEWGFMFPDKKDMTMAARSPQTWRRIRHARTGQFLTDQGLLTFHTTSIDINIHSGQRAALRTWKIVSLVPSQVLMPPWMYQISLLTLALLLALGLGSWFWARNRVDKARAQAALQESEQRFRDVARAAGEYIWETDRQWRYTYLSPQVEKVLGSSPDELLGRSLFDFIPPGERNERRSWFRKLAEQKKEFSGLELRTMDTSGRIIWQQMSGVPILDQDGGVRGYRGAGLDITVRKDMEAELKRLAITDPLTGAFNRRHFLEKGQVELERARRYGQELSVLMIDLDHFKHINDTYGHAAGDQVLREMVKTSSRILRSSDVFGRLGGEEFGAILPHTDPQSARETAERLRRALAEMAVSTSQGLVRFTVSIGVSMIERGDKDISQAMKRADQALYQAKAGGRDRVVEARARDCA